MSLRNTSIYSNRNSLSYLMLRKKVIELQDWSWN